MTDLSKTAPKSSQNEAQAPLDQTAPIQMAAPAAPFVTDQAHAEKAPPASGRKRMKKSAAVKAAKAQGADAADEAAGATDAKDGSHGGGGGGGGGSGVLYGLGGALLVGGGIALAAGGGSTTPTPSVPQDTTPPTAPTVTLGVDTGTSTSDRITSNGRVDIGSLETGASWEYSVNGGANWLAGTGSSFTLAQGNYADGAVQVRQKDAAGNVSPVARIAGTVTIDSTAPETAKLAAIAGDGIVNAAEKAAGITISGTAEAKSTVTITWGSVTKTVVVNDNGSWSVAFGSTEVPADGTSTITAKVTDLAGNVSSTTTLPVTIDTRLTVQGQVVAGPLVQGHGLTVDLFGSDGSRLATGVAVDAAGNFSARVAAKPGDIIIARIVDATSGADYADEATAQAKDLTSALFAAVLVTDLSKPVSAQINPLTTLAAMKAGLAPDGSGTIKGATALAEANALVAKAFGVSSLAIAPIATNAANFSVADGVSPAEQLGIVLAAISGVDLVNNGDSQKSLADLAAAIASEPSGLTQAGLDALFAGAMRAEPSVGAQIVSRLSTMMETANQATGLTIDSVAQDNVISSSELVGLSISGTVAEGTNAVSLRLGTTNAQAKLMGTSWSYTLTAEDVAALGADGAKLITATATKEGGATLHATRAVLLDTVAPNVSDVSLTHMASSGGATGLVINAKDKAAGISLTGTAEAGASIVVNWAGKSLPPTKADASGMWSLRLDKDQIPEDGLQAISVTATDGAGNSRQSAPQTILIDTKAPSAPTIAVVSHDDNLGSAELAGKVLISGTSELGVARVMITVPGQAQAIDAQVNAETGAWSALVDGATLGKAGAVTLSAVSVDVAGNVGGSATKTLTLYDSSKAPVIFKVTGDDVVNYNDAAQGFYIRGLAPASSQLSLVWGEYSNSNIVSDAQGNWQVFISATQGLPLDGSADLTVSVLDANQAPTASATRSILIDTLAPSVLQVNDIGTGNVVNATAKRGGITISGKAEPGATVVVDWAGSVSRQVADKETGNWSATFSPLQIPEGTHDVTITTIDAAENIGKTISTKVIVDSQPPVTPSFALNSVTGASVTDLVTKDDLVLVSGIEPGATWFYSTSNGEEGSWVQGGLINGQPAFRLAQNVYAPGSIVIKQQDGAGNVSPLFSNSKKVVIDQVAAEIVVQDDGISGNWVNAEKLETLSFSGVFEPDSVVRLKWAGEEKTVKTSSDGSWTATFAGSKPVQGENSLEITATDLAGNVAEKTLTYRVDTLPLPAPTAVALKEDTGRAANDGITNLPVLTVTLDSTAAGWRYRIKGGSWIEAVVNGPSDNLIEGLLDGLYQIGDIEVQQRDEAGNWSASAKLSAPITIDTAATGLTAGKVTADDVINAQEAQNGFTLSGNAEPNAQVTIAVYSSQTGTNTPKWSQTVTAGADGRWTISYQPAQTSTLAEGEQLRFEINQVDVAGNSQALDAKDVQVHVTAPTQPVFKTVPPSIAELDNKPVVNAALKSDLTISGDAPNAATVELHWGAMSGSPLSIAVVNGKWSYKFAAADLPPDGLQALKAVAVDAYGNRSSEAQLDILFDTEAKGLTLDPVSTDGRINALEKAAGITLSGQAEAGAQVNISWAGTSLAPLTADAVTGRWSVNVPPQNIPGNGLSTISVSQTDKAGNTTAQPITTQVAVDLDTPLAPKISAVATDNILDPAELGAIATTGILLQGSAEANSLISITWNGRTATTQTDTKGQWQYNWQTPLGNTLPAELPIRVVSTDAAGNSSVETRAFVAIRSTAPLVAPVTGDDIISSTEVAPAGYRIGGWAPDGVTSVTVKWNGTNLQSGSGTPVMQGAGKGNWTAIVPGLADSSGLQTLIATFTYADGTTQEVRRSVYFAPAAKAGEVQGTPFDDVVASGAGSDIIIGGLGNDILYGHSAGIAGGIDSNVFRWEEGDAGPVGSGGVTTDIIRDFIAWNPATSAGDKLDIAHLLQGYSAGADLSKWVISVQSDVTLPNAFGFDAGKTGTLISIDVDGEGAGTAIQQIFLTSVKLSSDVSELARNGVLVAI